MSTTTVAEKIERSLLKLFSTTHPGEIEAARDAILRLAKSAGGDMHTLAGAITRPPSSSSSPSSSPTPPRMRPGRLMASWLINNHGDDLSPKEHGFCRDMQYWSRLTPKQQ